MDWTMTYKTLALVVALLFLSGFPIDAAFLSLTRITRRNVGSPSSKHSSTFQSSRSTTTERALYTSSSRRLAAQNDDSETDDDRPKPGMEEAFRQLESLKSLGDDDAKTPDDSTPPELRKIDASAAKDIVVPKGEAVVSPEKEIQVYKAMVDELEQNEDAQAYSEIMSELGGAPKQTDDTYSQVLTDLGGSIPPASKQTGDGKRTKSPPTTLPKINLDASTDDDAPSTQDFMNDALQEAIKQVKVNNPKIKSDSILDDKEIMKDIEQIFEKGNEKLLESLEEIRQEQRALAKQSASQSAQNAVDAIQDDAARLQKAEQSMERMLQKVADETSQVEKAVADLKAANAELDKDLLYKLKQGGLPKQSALAGFLLFAVRSIVDSVTAIGGDEAAITTALAQGAIAVVCAAIFFFL